MATKNGKEAISDVTENDFTSAKRFDDEAEFKTLSSEFSFWSPLLEQKNAAGITTKSELVTLRGIPLVKRQRPESVKSQYDKAGNLIPQFYFVVCLTHPCRVRDYEGQIKDAKPGEYIWVDTRTALQALEPYLPQWRKLEDGTPDMLSTPSKVFECILRPEKRVATKRGFRVWKFDVKVRPLETAPKGANLLPPTTPEYSPNDVDPSERMGDAYEAPEARV
jgi:hypothetical protein